MSANGEQESREEKAIQDHEDFEKMPRAAEIPGDLYIKDLLQFFMQGIYSASLNDPRVTCANNRVLELMSKDYTLSLIDNTGGELSAYYPPQIPFCENERNSDGTIYENPPNFEMLQDLVKNAVHARCRQRFPVPVILYKGKYVCRSSTLAGTPEIFARLTINALRNAYSSPFSTNGPEEPSKKLKQSNSQQSNTNGNDPAKPAIDPNEVGMCYDEVEHTRSDAEAKPKNSNGDVEMSSNTNGEENQNDPRACSDVQKKSAKRAFEKENLRQDLDNCEWRGVSESQSADIQLLLQFNVGTIVDLMVENKKFKLGLPVTSSEKVRKTNRYNSLFSVMSMPFPGCEFFRDFHDQDYSATGLKFNWGQAMCDADLSVPPYPALDYLNIQWDDYKNWELIEMTQTYIKYLLKYLQDNDSGLLIHCISGWDRTPLFVSLIRISLWADGLVHQSLDEFDMLYLVLAYDWMLFGHQLSDRLAKNEDIMLFCFHFLKYLATDEFSLVKPKKKERSSQDDDKSTDLNADSMPMDVENIEHDYDEFLSTEPPSPAIIHPEESNDSFDMGHDSIYPGALSPASQEVRDLIGSRVFPMADEFDATAVGLVKRTSPVAIPNPRAISKTSSDSSFGSSASWQMVTAAGSVRSDSQSENETISLHDLHTNSEPLTGRTAKLKALRFLFYRCYYNTLSEDRVKYKTNLSHMQSLCYNIIDVTTGLAQNLK